MKLDGINHVALTVIDPGKSAEWYRDVLGFEIVGVNKPGNPLKITLGDQWLAIFPVGENPGEHPKRTDLAFQHLAFGSDFLEEDFLDDPFSSILKISSFVKYCL